MTALRQELLNMIEKMPEEDLLEIRDYMGLVTRKKYYIESGKEKYAKINKHDAYNELLKMIKPIENLDEKEELAKWREERFNV